MSFITKSDKFAMALIRCFESANFKRIVDLQRFVAFCLLSWGFFFCFNFKMHNVSMIPMSMHRYCMVLKQIHCWWSHAELERKIISGNVKELRSYEHEGVNLGRFARTYDWKYTFAPFNHDPKPCVRPIGAFEWKQQQQVHYIGPILAAVCDSHDLTSETPSKQLQSWACSASTHPSYIAYVLILVDRRKCIDREIASACRNFNTLFPFNLAAIGIPNIWRYRWSEWNKTWQTVLVQSRWC